MAKSSKRRLDIRQSLWHDADDVIYKATKSNPGWFLAPRTLPMIAALTKTLSPGIDPSRVYMDLWARAMDPPGFVEVTDELECANTSGFYGGESGGRAVRSWRERVDKLIDLGFIRVAPMGTRERGYVLLLDPNMVVQKLRAEKRIGTPWWSVFTHRVRSIGATLPEVPKPKAKTGSPFDDDDDLPF